MPSFCGFSQPSLSGCVRKVGSNMAPFRNCTGDRELVTVSVATRDSPNTVICHESRKAFYTLLIWKVINIALLKNKNVSKIGL